jgi:hypothetical protein
MPYSLFADLVLVIHAAFIVFVVFGGLLVLWRRGLVWLHIPCAIWGVVIELQGWICPLTYLENDLRAAGGGLSYPTGFIENYLTPLIYPPGLTPAVQTSLGLAVLLLNTIIYLLVWRWLRSRRNRSTR